MDKTPYLNRLPLKHLKIVCQCHLTKWQKYTLEETHMKEETKSNFSILAGLAATIAATAVTGSYEVLGWGMIGTTALVGADVVKNVIREGDYRGQSLGARIGAGLFSLGAAGSVAYYGITASVHEAMYATLAALAVGAVARTTWALTEKRANNPQIDSGIESSITPVSNGVTTDTHDRSASLSRGVLQDPVIDGREEEPICFLKGLSPFPPTDPTAGVQEEQLTPSGGLSDGSTVVETGAAKDDPKLKV